LVEPKRLLTITRLPINSAWPHEATTVPVQMLRYLQSQTNSQLYIWVSN